MHTWDNINTHLVNFINELIESNKVYNITSVKFELGFLDDIYRSYYKEEGELFKKTLNSPNYRISFYLHLGENSYKFIGSGEYNDPYKCLMDVQCRVENEIYLNEQLNKMAQKLEEFNDKSINEISFLKAELQEAIEAENYEKAKEIKQKIETLSNP